MERLTFKRVTGIRLWTVVREVTPSPRENDKILTNHGEHTFITSLPCGNLWKSKHSSDYRGGASEVYTTSVFKKILFLSTLDVSHSTCFLFVCSFIRLRSVIDARMLLEAPDLLGPYEPYETNIEGS